MKGCRLLRPTRAIATLAVSLAAMAAAPAAWADPEPAPIPAGPAPAPAEPPVVLRPPPAAPVPAAKPAAAPIARDSAETDRPDAEQTNVHGIGVAGSFATGTGLTYRRYFGNTSLQLTCLAIITDRGRDAVAFAGGSVVQYVLVWNSAGARGLLPSSSALRLVGGAHYYLRKWLENTTTEPTNGIITPASVQKRTSSVNVGAGLGFEFGAIVKSGFSLSLDLVLTAAFDDKGLDYILPLPQAALVYSW